MTERLHFHFSFHALEKEMAAYSSVLAWRIPGTGEPGRLLSMGSHRVGYNWSDLAAAATTDIAFFIKWSFVQPSVEQVYRCHFSNSICLYPVSYVGNLVILFNISDFFYYYIGFGDMWSVISVWHYFCNYFGGVANHAYIYNWPKI